MLVRTIVFSFSTCVLLAACEDPPPPRSVDSFMNNRTTLDSTLLRCNAHRERTMTDPDCINARKAVARIAAQDEKEAKASLEAQSERKRDQLRNQREARDRILAERRRQEEVDAAARQLAAFTGSTDLPSAAMVGDQPDGTTAILPAGPTQQLPPGVSPATEPVAAIPVASGDVARSPALDGVGENAAYAAPQAQTPVQPSAVTDPVSAGANYLSAAPAASNPGAVPTAEPQISSNDLEAEIRRLEAELRNRREAEIRRLEEELRLKKAQSQSVDPDTGSDTDVTD